MRVSAHATPRPRPPARARRCVARLLAALMAAAVLLIGGVALAFVPPPQEGHVTDKSFKLDARDDRVLERRLEDLRQADGYEIAFLLIPSLEGESIEDVAYTTFNTWKLGQKGVDNGVLVVIVPGDRKVRIETGKGAGGALTDLQSNDIIRNVMGPLLKQDRFRDAIAAGGDAIDKAMREGGVAGTPPGANGQPTMSRPMSIGIIVLVVAFLIFLNWLARRGGGFGGGGGWSGGGGGWSGGGGGGGSWSGGGGGASGGGGSSDSY